MPYIAQTWSDNDTTKPVSAARMNYIETGLAAVANGGLPLAPSRVGARTKVYDPARNVYNLKASNTRKWRAALAKARAGVAAARLNCYGDSITDGYLAGTVPIGTGSYPSRLRTLFDTDYGAAGTGVVWVEADTDENRFTYSGASWAVLGAGFGPFGNWSRSNNNGAGGDYVTFGAVTADSFRIYTIGNSTSGSYDVSVDGGAATTLSTVRGVSPTDNAPKILTFNTTNASHTLKVLHRADATTVYLCGIEATIGTSGVRVSRIGRGGALAGSVLDGYGVDASGAAGSAPFVFDSIPPDMSVIFLQHNDYLTSESIATFKTKLQALITKAATFGDVLLVTGIPNSNTALVPSQISFDSAIYDLADTNDVAVLDMADRWGSYAALSASLYGDVTHPNGSGYYDIANSVYNAIGRI